MTGISIRFKFQEESHVKKLGTFLPWYDTMSMFPVIISDTEALDQMNTLIYHVLVTGLPCELCLNKITAVITYHKNVI